MNTGIVGRLWKKKGGFGWDFLFFLGGGVRRINPLRGSFVFSECKNKNGKVSFVILGLHFCKNPLEIIWNNKTAQIDPCSVLFRYFAQCINHVIPMMIVINYRLSSTI